MIKEFTRGIGENRTRFQHPEWTVLSYGIKYTYFKDGIGSQEIQKKKLKNEKEKGKSHGKGDGAEEGTKDWTEVPIYYMLINKEHYYI